MYFVLLLYAECSEICTEDEINEAPPASSNTDTGPSDKCRYCDGLDQPHRDNTLTPSRSQDR